MTSKPRGVLCVGVTGDLASRVGQHRIGAGSAFCRRSYLTCLVLAEHHETIRREKVLEAWRRDWKITLIEASNPDWRDLGAEAAAYA